MPLRVKAAPGDVEVAALRTRHRSKTARGCESPSLQKYCNCLVDTTFIHLSLFTALLSFFLLIFLCII